VSTQAVVEDCASFAVGDLIFPPIDSPSALLIAFALEVFKPWGPDPQAPDAAGRLTMSSASQEVYDPKRHR